jgi:DNA invertase Pin-like site-specific DNA recombinase
MAKTKKAIAYVRVSTKDQGENGAGLDLQVTRIHAFAKAAGYEIVDTFRDAQSAVGADSIKSRPGVRAALERSKSTGFPIIVDGWDRLVREVKKMEELVRDGKLNVISAKSGEGARHAVVLAEGARGQAEAERIRRTTREGLRRARARGVILGNTKNLGEAQMKGVAANRAKADGLAKQLAPVVKEIRAAGVKTKKEIAAELNRLGYRTPRNEPWSATTIRRPLDRIEELAKRELYSDSPKWGIF